MKQDEAKVHKWLGWLKQSKSKNQFVVDVMTHDNYSHTQARTIYDRVKRVEELMSDGMNLDTAWSRAATDEWLRRKIKAKRA